MTTESEILNQLIESYQVPKDDTITTMDYKSKVYQDKFLLITFIQKSDSEVFEDTLMYNLESDHPALLSDFYSEKTIGYLSHKERKDKALTGDYNQYIKETDFNNKKLSIDDTSLYIDGNPYPFTLEEGLDTYFSLNVETGDKLIAMTFDDGPHQSNTQEAMRILEKYKGQGTFFVLGPRAQMFPDIIRETADRNHQIASHTFNHRNLRKLTDEDISFEILETERILQRILNNPDPIMVRPPYGSVSPTIRNTFPKVYVNWDVDSNDWDADTPESVCNEIYNTAQNNSIVLMHDLYENTIKGFECAVERLSADGYQFVSVDTLLKANGIIPQEGNIYFSGR